MDCADPEYQLVRLSVERAQERIQEIGWNNITKQERDLINVFQLYQEVRRGGFRGIYFEASSLPDKAAEVMRSTIMVGALRAGQIFQNSIACFSGFRIPSGLDARIAALESNPAAFECLQQFDNDFYACPDDDVQLLAAYIERNRTQFGLV